MKKFLCLLLVVIMCVLVVGCENTSSPTTTKETIDTTVETTVVITEPTTRKPTEPTTTETPKLSESCDEVVADGYDSDGNYFEFVMNQEESYDGVKTEIGVIKNNEWSAELREIVRYEVKFQYIGCGCFADEYYILNGNNGLFYDCYGSSFGPAIAEHGGRYGNYYVNDEDKVILFSQSEKLKYKVLDLNTMKATDYTREGSDAFNAITYFPYSEGMFAVLGDGGNSGFYNLTGEKVIDLQDYNFVDRDWLNLYFEDGECSFIVFNEHRTRFNVTINTKGEVIDSYEVNAAGNRVE